MPLTETQKDAVSCIGKQCRIFCTDGAVFEGVLDGCDDKFNVCLKESSALVPEGGHGPLVKEYGQYMMIRGDRMACIGVVDPMKEPSQRPVRPLPPMPDHLT